MLDKEDFNFIGGFIVFVIIVAVLLAGVGGSLSSAACTSTADKMGLESSWSFMTDCMVKVPASMFQDAHWVPLSSYRVAEVKQ